MTSVWNQRTQFEHTWQGRGKVEQSLVSREMFPYPFLFSKVDCPKRCGNACVDTKMLMFFQETESRGEDGTYDHESKS